MIPLWNVLKKKKSKKTKTKTHLCSSHSLRLSAISVFHQGLSKASPLLQVRTILSTQKAHSALFLNLPLSPDSSKKGSPCSFQPSLPDTQLRGRCCHFPYPIPEVERSAAASLFGSVFNLMEFFRGGMRNAGSGSRIVFSSGNCRGWHHMAGAGVVAVGGKVCWAAGRRRGLRRWGKQQHSLGSSPANSPWDPCRQTVFIHSAGWSPVSLVSWLR